MSFSILLRYCSFFTGPAFSAEPFQVCGSVAILLSAKILHFTTKLFACNLYELFLFTRSSKQQ